MNYTLNINNGNDEYLTPEPLHSQLLSPAQDLHDYADHAFPLVYGRVLSDDAVPAQPAAQPDEAHTPHDREGHREQLPLDELGTNFLGEYYHHNINDGNSKNIDLTNSLSSGIPRRLLPEPGLQPYPEEDSREPRKITSFYHMFDDTFNEDLANFANYPAKINLDTLESEFISLPTSSSSCGNPSTVTRTDPTAATRSSTATTPTD